MNTYRVSWWENISFSGMMSTTPTRELKHRDVQADGYVIERCGAVTFWSKKLESKNLFLTIRSYDQVERVVE